MKVVFVISLYAVAFAMPAFAQDQSAMASAESACGPKDVNFVAKEDTTQHPMPQPDTEKAMVYVVQDECVGCGTIRVGMDGAWVGANPSGTYSFSAAKPGEHHLCVNLQSRFKVNNKRFAMANFTAEAGRVYYFRARIYASKDFSYFDLEPVNSDEGKYLVASSAFSVWHPKK